MKFNLKFQVDEFLVGESVVRDWFLSLLSSGSKSKGPVPLRWGSWLAWSSSVMEALMLQQNVPFLLPSKKGKSVQVEPVPEPTPTDMTLYDKFKLNPGSLGDITYQLSVKRCENAIPLAKAEYLSHLPEYYHSALHRRATERALRVFHTTGRGPAQEEFVKVVWEECGKIWREGRQSCDAKSLTGNGCILLRHNFQDENGNATSHTSSQTFLQACPCGKIRGNREDPFEISEIDKFFDQLEKKCCYNLPSLVQLENSHGNRWYIHRLGPSNQYQSKSGVLQDGFIPGRNFLIPMGPSFPIRPMTSLGHVTLEDFKLNPIKKTGLGGMVSRARAHQKNATPRDFQVQYTNPPPAANVPTVQHAKPENSSNSRDRSNRRSRSNRSTNSSTSTSQSSQNSQVQDENAETGLTYLGVEYECRQGHRFFSQDPRIISYKGNQGDEIFIECPCKTSVAQLQRLYIVTSKLPTPILFRPRIEFHIQRENNPNLEESDVVSTPSSHGDTMTVTSSPGEIILPPSSFLVICLPFVYRFGGKPINQGHVLPPSTALLKDSFVWSTRENAQRLEGHR
eukprot:TRINITY_DN1142_c2_g2_i3.p1 TRINITY_DN1142_c2_g2~~TRINITY_DN1142_c2_g2_i3.p1  ORF type:complete len:566 (+),score=186.81 TRINITY_DN1142_c2_g2_i3:942-2639(+)